MWILITSDGHRIAGIRSEMDARRNVHTLGVRDGQIVSLVIVFNQPVDY